MSLGVAIAGATVNGDAFNFLTDCVTSARRKGVQVKVMEGGENKTIETYQYL